MHPPLNNYLLNYCAVPF